MTLPAMFAPMKARERIARGDSCSVDDLVNLNRARKAKAKAERTAIADANRTKFGRTAAQKASDAADKARAARLLDDARREDDA
ncbi:DUF4169 family protein [Sphingomonas sp. Y38-1Y]|uniref:DUF4169 family protein n=1 Tax=Sphingomonas sp. Y38-1Y TaxID=3078265 RepID=UPI0028E70267|nr:DUF4169 family protein [Sphingomonas sp. Y38-1Y]